MRHVDQHTQDRLGAQSAKTAHVLRIFREDGAVIGLTDHDRDIAFGGVVHLAQPGIGFDGLQQTADLAPDFALVRSSLASGGIVEDDLEAELFARSRAEIWRVDPEDTSARLLLSVGTIGEIARSGDALEIEFRGMAQALAKPVGRVFQKSCDAELGDARCGVDLDASGRRRQGTVLQADGLSVEISLAGAADPHLFAHGTLSLVGSRANRPIRAVRAITGGLSLTLWEEFAVTLRAGDTVEISAGCDKRFATCRDRFSNHERFRGFPSIPGMDVLTVRPGAEG